MNHYLEFMCEICGKPQSQCKCCRVLLTEEEIKQVVATVPIDEFTTSYEYGQQLLAEYQRKVNQAIAKAQLKKVLDYLDKRSISFQPTGEGAVWVISCDRQALLEEVK